MAISWSKETIVTASKSCKNCETILCFSRDVKVVVLVLQFLREWNSILRKVFLEGLALDNIW